ncbi:MAG: hypothetical protein WCF90_01975 [Methanomicrobiales archaeon]
MIVLTSGCTSSVSDNGSSSSATDDGKFHSSFAELKGIYVNVGNPASSIVLNSYGGARIIKVHRELTRPFRWKWANYISLTEHLLAIYLSKTGR